MRMFPARLQDLAPRRSAIWLLAHALAFMASLFVAFVTFIIINIPINDDDLSSMEEWSWLTAGIMRSLIGLTAGAILALILGAVARYGCASPYARWSAVLVFAPVVLAAFGGVALFVHDKPYI